MLKVFISHSGKDKPFVRKLKEDLNFNDIETWLDQDELKIGDKLYDSLMLGLESSTHFLIVLSNNIKGSDWVETEINEAISALDKNIIQKIIPVILRKTEIPNVFKSLYHADFSSVVFSINGEKVQFTGDVYQKELEKIVIAIKESEKYLLSKSEKTTIVAETDKQSNDHHNPVVVLYEIAGFASIDSRYSYIEKIKSQVKNTLLNKIPTNEIMPVILPHLLKPLFRNLIIGEKLFFRDVLEDFELEGHFCGFSSNNTRIILPGRLRKSLDVLPQDIIKFEIDGINRRITVID